MAGCVVLGAVVGPLAAATVHPRRLDPQPAEARAATPPSLVLPDGGLEFPDGSVQTTAAQLVLMGPVLIPVTGAGAVCYDGDGVVVTCETGIGSGQDGALQMGVSWPIPRFTVNADGTVTDNLTGLIWLAEADCFGKTFWGDALDKANGLFDGSTNDPGGGDCGLSDGSALGAWRLPSGRELQSLAHYGVHTPALPNTEGTGQWVEGDPFSGVPLPSYYWSSTTIAGQPENALVALFNNGSLGAWNKSGGERAPVWPVRRQLRAAAPQASAPPSLTLDDGGIEFPDGSVQTTAAQRLLIGPALVPVTGAGPICYDEVGVVVTCGTGIGLNQDGDLQPGVHWPIPRFTDNTDGTVTDSLTGLIWLRAANCFGKQVWGDALARANGLFDGSTNDPGGGDCGLSDGSMVGAWRLPNVRELQSLAHYGVQMPAVPNTTGTGQWVEGDPFVGLPSPSSNWSSYWSSTTNAGNPAHAWNVLFRGGYATNSNKRADFYVWPVRGGQ